ILNAIAEMKRENVVQRDHQETLAAAGSLGERRQLTVIFCDLVGSTALSTVLDPEELRALIHNYRQVCTEVVARFDGHVAQYTGDGLMIYFGWPQAYEDAAERGVRAALEMVEAVKVMGGSRPLEVRLGLATGTVVVSEASLRDPSGATT